MHRKSEMTMMGKMQYFLGLQVKQKTNEIFISQEKYTKEVINKFNPEKTK